MSGIRDRSYHPITRADLDRLAGLAAADRDARFTRRPRWGVYRDRLICVALCQSAALHYVNGKNGVKDFDVWTFFAEHAEGPFPYRWLTAADFGPSHFGRRVSEPGQCTFSGRRVDFNARSLAEPTDADPIAALMRYLGTGRTESARKLAEKAVVIIEPLPLRGLVAWTPDGWR
jgi:hypothetical protein